jgi:hypothetical protein
VAAADVRHARPRLELLYHALERGKPAWHQVLPVPGAEECLGSGEQAVVVLAPGQAGAAPECFDQAVLVREERREDVVRAQQVELALFVGERDRLLRRDGVSPGRIVVGHVTAGCLIAEPLAHHPRLGPGSLGKLRRRRGTALREGAIEAKPRTESNERRTERGRQVDHGLPHERVEPRPVDCCRCHWTPPERGMTARSSGASAIPPQAQRKRVAIRCLGALGGDLRTSNPRSIARLGANWVPEPRQSAPKPGTELRRITAPMCPICRDKSELACDQGLLAMQKVEGSSPFSRFDEGPAVMAFPCCLAGDMRPRRRDPSCLPEAFSGSSRPARLRLLKCVIAWDLTRPAGAAPGLHGHTSSSPCRTHLEQPRRSGAPDRDRGRSRSGARSPD